MQSLQAATNPRLHANTPLSAQDKNPGADARAAFEALNKAHRELKDPGSRVRALPSPPAACACPRATFQDTLQCMLMLALQGHDARPQLSGLVSTCHQSSGGACRTLLQEPCSISSVWERLAQRLGSLQRCRGIRSRIAHTCKPTGYCRSMRSAG